MKRRLLPFLSSFNHCSRRRFCFLPLGVLLVLSIFSQNASAQIYVIGSEKQFGTIDPTTGVITTIGLTTTDFGPTAFSGLAWTPNTNQFYSVRGDEGIDNGLYRINPTNAVTTFLKDIGVPLATITSRIDGVLFGFSADFTNNTNTLWRINPLTEMTATQIGAAGGLGTASLGALTFGGDGNLYMLNNTTDQLFLVNTTTGTTTPVGTGTGTTEMYGMVGDSNGAYYGFSATNRNIYNLNLSAGTATQGAQYTFGPANPLDLILGATAVIPEPTTLALLLVGAPFLLAKRRKKRTV
jgi:hypothetical protein